MNAPLCCYLSRNKLVMYRNGRRQYVDWPFGIYFYSKFRLDDISDTCQIVQEKIKLLSTGKETEVFKHVFSNVESYRDGLNKHQTEILYNESFLHCILIDKPEFFSQFTNEKPLKVLALDIEVLSDGTSTFPRAETTGICCIGLKMYDFDHTFTEVKSGVVECYNHPENEKQMLESFIDIYEEFNPDIIIGYNIKRFDIPYICTRMKMLLGSTARLNRDSPYDVDLSPLQKSMFKQHKTIYDTKIKLHGRVIYDVYVACQRDNKLRKLRDYKLDTIATWFGWPAKTLEKGITANLKKFIDDGHSNELNEYVLHDVQLSVNIAGVYLQGRVLAAEIVGAPLDMIINDYPTFVPSLIHARPLRAAGFIGDARNSERYSSMAYQGAYVGLKKRGMFKPAYHIDFSSMYPSIIRSFNLSPETTWMIRNEAGTQKPVFIDKGDYYELSLPDKEFGGNVVIGISKKPGILPAQMTQMYNKRLEFKKKYRESHDEKDNSLQNIYKLYLNTSYGYDGSGFARWGNLTVAIATTGLGRYIVKKVVDDIGEPVIETDTDGIYTDKLIDVKKLTEILGDEIRGFGFPSYMELDYDVHEVLYVYRMKNYIILDKGKLSFSGNSFISRRQPRLVQKALERLIWAKMKDDKVELQKVLKEIYDFDKYSIHDYSMNVRLWHDINEYKSENALARQLAIQARDRFGEDISIRTQLSYVVTKYSKEKYKLVDLCKVSDISHKYYRAELDKIVERLDLHRNMLLTEFM